MDFIVPIVAGTALGGLLEAGAPWAEDDAPVVMVLGGAGGCGSAAIQLALALGARAVYATTSAGPHAHFVAALGATRVFDYHTEDWTRLLGADSVDVVFDTVGIRGTAERAMPTIRTGHTWSRTGSAFMMAAGRATAHPKAGVSQRFVRAWIEHNKWFDLDLLASLIAAGKLRASIQCVSPLAEYPRAAAVHASGHVAGKVAIAVGNWLEAGADRHPQC